MSGAWPPIVWGAAVLRGLEPRARTEIEAAGSLRELARDETLYSAGNGGDSFYVVARGGVALSAVRRGDDRETEIRVAKPGESLGEEATIGTARKATATARAASLVAEIPVHVFRRAAERSGKAESADKLERTLLRGAIRDLCHSLAFTRDLPERDLDLLLDATVARRFERGDFVYRQGDPPRDFWLVADGMIQLQTEDLDRVHVRAFVARGDFFGDAEITADEPRRVSAVVSGASLLFAVPAKVLRTLSDRNPDLLPRLRRIAIEGQAVQAAIVRQAAHNTQHAFRDLYRLDVARSLLVIDLETCVRCGHCAWACADVHSVARLVRRGDKIVTRLASDELAAPQTLMLPNSCQHCENPACMPDCPTGAIGRDPEGEVFVREPLCTGCGACAKACPWDNIQMAPRARGAEAPSGGAFAEVAVKCDLCRDYEGPACVKACPTSSIFRVNPADELADVRDLLGGALGGSTRPTRVSGAPGIAGGAVAGAAIAIVGATMQSRGAWQPARGLGFGAGVACATGFVLLLAYALPKRGVRLWMRKRGRRRAMDDRAGAPSPPARSIVHPQAVAHIAIGLVTLGLAFAHAPSPPWRATGAGGAAFVAFLASALAGVFMGVAYAVIPTRLARIERTAALPEDLEEERKGLVEKLYREASGRSEVVKKILEKILLPYATHPLGPVALVASGRRLRDEEAAVRANVDAVLEGRGGERLAGLPELIRVVVELRALPAQRFLQRTLRVGLPVHVITFGIACALLAVHVVTALMRYR
jgi:Fe-S-cluster-containing dehydrogenase component/CRP-like cAMP-binding protein